MCFRTSSLNPNLWDQEWHSGDKARLLPLWPEFDFWTSWIEFVVGSRVFPQVLRFPFLYKDQHSKFQFELETADKSPREPPRGVSTAASRSLLIYLLSRLILTGREDRCRNRSPS